MCGIAGIVGEVDRDRAAEAVQTMMQSLARRGPDSDGMSVWPGAILGHRRLAIFDLSAAGAQPMLSRDGSVGVVFNGAIYNFPELRSELLGLGHEFKSRTDTEVLVAGYLEWGIDILVKRLRGMFAFALWDDRRGKLFLVRDRLGVKPLIFAERDGSIAFASTVRALGAVGYAADLDEAAVVEYLGFGFVTDESAIYRGVVKVPAATIVEWSRGRRSQRKYWDPPAATRSESLPFEDAVEQTEHLLLDAVSVRLNADVPVGALLSGGIDSSLICWAIARMGGDVTAYTVGTPGDPGDETRAARQTAVRLGIRHEVLEMSENQPPEISELVSAYAEPFACSSALGMLRVSRAVRSAAKVLLTGDGGDDVFLGYPRHRHLALAARLARVFPQSAGSLWRGVRSSVPRIGPLRRGAALLDYTFGGLDAYLAARGGLTPYLERGLLGPRLREVATAARPPRGVRAQDALEEFLDYERRTQFVGEYMTKVDGATMYYGLEARSPFLDHHLWEFAASLPSGLRLRGFRLKAVLRELVRRRIGREVATRRKRGFHVPVQRWSSGHWGKDVRSALGSSFLVRQGLIDPRALRELIERPEGRYAADMMWSLFVLDRWLGHEANVETRALEAPPAFARSTRRL
jgi:asparagine synthase (glutamine-hydrolysing)